MNALIADDDDITRLLLSSALSKLGHQVHQAANGQHAWDAWQTGCYQLLISDWMMPDINGIDFCRRIRAAPSSAYTYIILLTSRSGKTHYLEAMNAGADDFVTKPFEKDEFAARIRVAERILGLHATLRESNAELEERVAERTRELERALRIKNDFLSRVSHELRTPLNHVLGFAQLLQHDLLTDTQYQNVEHVLDGGRRLVEIVDALLAAADAKDLDFCERFTNDAVDADTLAALR